MSLQQYVVDTLGLRIARGEAAEGALLNPVRLGQEYGVSRTVVREAFRGLEARGMIRARPRVGTVVQPSSEWDLLDPEVIRWRDASPSAATQLRELMTLREAIEPTSAELAASLATDAELDELESHCQAMEEAVRERAVDAFVRSDAAFHRIIVHGSRNVAIRQLLGTLEATLHSRYSARLPVFSEATGESLARHRQIVESMRRRDGEQAALLMRTLIREAREELFRMGALD